MRKFYFFTICFLVELSLDAQSTNPAPYCASEYITTISSIQIKKVQLGTLNNSTGLTSTPGYMYYSNLSSPSISIGSSNTITINFANGYNSALKCWIDYNKNGNFESSELIHSLPYSSIPLGLNLGSSGNFTVPISSSIGMTRMRVSLGWHYSNVSASTVTLDTCHVSSTGDGSWGETEDYDLFIINDVGIMESFLNKDFILYPNPSHNQINVPESVILKTISYEIIDCLGKKLICSEKFPINVSELQHGLYYVRFYLKEGRTLDMKLQVN